MKKLIIALCFCVGALHAHNVMANGENNGPKCNNRSCNETTNNVDNSTTNKAYGGDGGSAYSKAYGGNAKAYGGSAYQGQDQYQGQGQYQKNTGINGQGQSLTNNGPQVELNQVYEAQERDPVNTAYGHASHRYECVVGVGGGAQAANFGISISGGYESTLCNLGYVAKFLPRGDERYTKLVGAMYDIAMDAAGYGPDTSTKRDPSVRDGR